MIRAKQKKYEERDKNSTADRQEMKTVNHFHSVGNTVDFAEQREHVGEVVMVDKEHVRTLVILVERHCEGMMKRKFKKRNR